MSQITGENSIIIDAPAASIWNLLEDTTVLPQWCTMVKSTTGTREHVGAVRKCTVDFEGRQDEVVERCVELVPNQRISWVMDQGFMTKLFSHVQMGFSMEPAGSKTKLTCLGIFQPKNFFTALLYKFMLSGKMSTTRQSFLVNIKKLAEKAPIAS
jgi:uncharacterized protein YndB with AHSA1/START domain